jgi:hypothetical protein
MSRLMTEPSPPLPYGGAHDWDEVAERMLAAVEQHAESPVAPARTRGPLLVRA